MKTRFLGSLVGCVVLLGFGGCALNQTNEPPKKQEVIIKKEQPKKVVKATNKKPTKQTVKVGQKAEPAVQPDSEPAQNDQKTQNTSANEPYKYTIILD